jgi:hypothetical protein
MRIVVFTCIAVFLVLSSPSPAAAEEKRTPTEAEKIDALIGAVEQLKDARFIRNGKEYDCQAAADHMRRKRKGAGDRVKTAREFVTHVASRSERSGEPYKIKFKDGKQETSEAFLTKELDKLEGKSQVSK